MNKHEKKTHEWRSLKLNDTWSQWYKHAWTLVLSFHYCDGSLPEKAHQLSAGNGPEEGNK